MRKFISVFCILCAAVSVYAQADSTRVNVEKGIHPFKLEQNANVSWGRARWSIIPYVGVNLFDGDYLASEYKGLTGLMSYPTLGLGIECAFNPAWGIGLEYDFHRYGVAGDTKTTKAKNADVLLKGQAHMADLYLMADLIDLFHPYAKKKVVALTVLAGAGGALNKNSVFYPASQDNTEGRTSRGNTADPSVKDSAMTGFDFHPFVKFGAGLEFNLNRSLALGLRFSYNLFMDDLVEGRKFDPNCDGIIDLTLNMRIKLAAVSKSHARNVPGRDWLDRKGVYTGEVRELVEKEVARLKPTENITNVYTTNAVAEAAIGHDTVIIYRDTVIIREGASASPEAIAAAAAAASRARTYYVYFGPEKTKLDKEGLITVQQVADHMAADPSLYALIVGYCDNTGSRAFNYELGDKRANSVADELRAEYGIAADHLYASGKGVVVGRRSTAAYGPNRRVEIKLVDKEAFDKARAELDNERSSRVYGQAQTETVGENTTLAQLARKHYGNTHCWVYIYSANKEKIANPNALTPGMELQIPQITAEEQKITKDQCLALYKQARK